MRLCDHDIEQALNRGRISITPRPDPSRISGVTVDMTLGNEFRVFRNHTLPYIDLTGPSEALSAALEAVVCAPVQLEEGSLFFLHPGALALGVMREHVTLPDDLVGWLDGRSSLARLGLMVHMTAHRLDPGWNGKIVLEFYNAGPIPLALKPGMCIGAISFEEMSAPAQRPYATRPGAKYKNQRGAERSRLEQETLTPTR